jgi:hypothetical protein
MYCNEYPTKPETQEWIDLWVRPAKVQTYMLYLEYKFLIYHLITNIRLKYI